MLLAGDIGGTKTTLMLVSEAGPRSPLAEATFPSAEYSHLTAVVDAFLAQVDVRVRVNQACFGVAGPVVNGRASITNLPWTLDEVQLQEALNLSSVRLINDLVAIAYAVPSLGGNDLHTLNEGQTVPGGAIAVIAPGTGLGEAYLTWDGNRYWPHPSEGGHADFAPTNSSEVDLLRYLQERMEHVSYESICSGLGLPNIYAYLRDSGQGEEPAWLAQKLAEVDDPTPVIVGVALGKESKKRTCELCEAALEMFVSILGAEAGNLALKVLATGGVYLGGGIPPRILSALAGGQFLASFRSKGRFFGLLAQMPIHVIVNPKAALLGAARYGLGLG
ncbi:MAG TPA: glucokinase [Chloroflexi bacterium]|nr:glucokinase [Chloroflexota bacterium]